MSPFGGEGGGEAVVGVGMLFCAGCAIKHDERTAGGRAAGRKAKGVPGLGDSGGGKRSWELSYCFVIGVR